MQPTVVAATHSSPDFLALQLDDLDGTAVEAVRTLFRARAFTTVTETDDLELQPSTGCLLTRLDLLDAELVVTVGAAGASRVPLSGLDPAWLERAVVTGHAAVLLVASAVRDGAVTREDLRRDADAGVVLAALVPCADRAPG